MGVRGIVPAGMAINRWLLDLPRTTEGLVDFAGARFDKKERRILVSVDRAGRRTPVCRRPVVMSICSSRWIKTPAAVRLSCRID